MCQLAITSDAIETVDAAVGQLAFSTIETAAGILGVAPSRLLEALLGENHDLGRALEP
jgi:hypothetical protein